MQQTVQLAPGQSAPEIVPGKYLTIVSCTAAFAVELDNAGKNVAVAGSQFGKGDGFSRLTFFETSGVANTIVYDASDFPSPGRGTLVQSESATFTGPNSGHYDLGSARVPKSLEGLLFSGIQGGKYRKVIYITNLAMESLGGIASTAVVVVGSGVSTASFIYAVIQPNETLPIETSSDLQLFAYTANLSAPASHLMVSVLDVFYSKPTQSDQ